MDLWVNRSISPYGYRSLYIHIEMTKVKCEGVSSFIAQIRRLSLNFCRLGGDKDVWD